MGLFSRPPSLTSLDKREVEELRSVLRGLAERFPEAAKAIQGLLGFALAEPLLQPPREEDVALIRHAVSILEVAAKEQPESFIFPYRLCDLYINWEWFPNVDRFLDALATAKEMVIAFPKDPRSWYALTSVYHTLGRAREKEIAPEILKLMREAFSPVELRKLLVSEALDEACQKLALTPMRASELAAQYFRRTLEVGVRRDERPHVEECLRTALELYRSRAPGKPTL